MKISDEISRTFSDKKKVVATRQKKIPILFALLPYGCTIFYYPYKLSVTLLLDSCKLKTNKFELKTGRFFIKLCHSTLHPRFFLICYDLKYRYTDP